MLNSFRSLQHTFVDEHQPGPVNHAPLSHPTPARAGHVGSLLLRCVQAFFEADAVASEQPPDCTATTANPSLAHGDTISFSVKSGCLAIRANSQSACSSSGEMLPPVGLAASLPVSCQRCSHFTAELALTSMYSAASRRDVPAITASSRRRRKSKEQGFGIDRLPRINAVRFAYPRKVENPRFNSAETGSSREEPPT